MMCTDKYCVCKPTGQRVWNAAAVTETRRIPSWLYQWRQSVDVGSPSRIWLTGFIKSNQVTQSHVLNILPRWFTYESSLCLVEMDGVTRSGGCSWIKGQVVGVLYARSSASHRTRALLISAFLKGVPTLLLCKLRIIFRCSTWQISCAPEYVSSILWVQCMLCYILMEKQKKLLLSVGLYEVMLNIRRLMCEVFNNLLNIHTGY